MPWETPKERKDDPCLDMYPHRDVAKREIHVNLSLKRIRVYVRAKSAVHKFGPIVSGPDTINMARKSGWCHIHSVVNKVKKSPHGLLNFVVFCPKREIGFHSDMWMKGGKKVVIPGGESAGCIRLPHAESKNFFDLVKDGDGVRLYKQNFWRPPLFAFGTIHAHCS